MIDIKGVRRGWTAMYRPLIRCYWTLYGEEGGELLMLTREARERYRPFDRKCPVPSK